MRPLVLASSSPYRRELLARLRLSFDCDSPEIDENRHPGESAAALVARLAEEKARAVAQRHPEALVIGSDQVSVRDDEILGKPGDHATAVAQLRAASGRRVTFQTGLCVLDGASGRYEVDVVPYHVTFRELSDARIEHYLAAEQPYDCAGAFRSEGLGVALFERMEGDDPAALIGLPLIRLVRMLEAAGVTVI